MKIYMNKKNSENVTLIAITDDRYIIETAAGAQKSYSTSSFKKMFKFIEEIDENQTTLDTANTISEGSEEFDINECDEPDYFEQQKIAEAEAVEGVEAETVAVDNNGWEKIAKKNLKEAYNWIVGGLENTLQDCEEDSEEYRSAKKTLTDAESLAIEIYHEGITTFFGDGMCGGKAPAEMRFAGKDFCISYITKLLKKDGYLTTPKEEKVIVVKMVAFTGMNIGEFNAVVTKQGYEVATKHTGVLHFDKKGIQTDAKNPKFGNKLILK